MIQFYQYFYSCLPTITTSAISSILQPLLRWRQRGFRRRGNGNGKGICWSMTANPVVTGNIPQTEQVQGIYQCITSLTAGTAYHVRAYATNSIGTGLWWRCSIHNQCFLPDVYVVGYENSGTMMLQSFGKMLLATSLTMAPVMLW